MQKTEHTSTTSSRRRIRRKSRGFRRFWLALGAATAVFLVGAGGFLAFENTLPTSVDLNLRNGQKDVSTSSQLLFTFSRPVAQSSVEGALSIVPLADGTLSATSGQTQYAWSPSQPLSDLTTYTVTLGPMTDLSHHRIPGGRWTFTTTIVPHVVSVTGAGVALTDGSEIDPGTALTVNFNDAMTPLTVQFTIRAQAASLKWAPDDRSAAISTAGMPSGPLALQLLPGGRDQTGHKVEASFTLQTGLYYHDHEHRIALRYPALIQVPNDYFARDQNGLQAAEIVFEYLAEGGITRCTAIYQYVPDLVGPMRSSRFISLKIARHYDGLLFQSGESQATASAEAANPVPQFFNTIGYMFRTSARYPPDNLMIRGAGVQAAEQNYFASIPAFVVPKARPDLSGGSGATTVTVPEHHSVYAYDPVMGTYQKTEEGHSYADASLRQPLRIEMLIVLHTAETLLNVGDGHGAHIHDFNLDSGGLVQIYYKGLGYQGSWSAPNSHGPLTFTLANGQPVTLPPGLVWIDVVA